MIAVVEVRNGQLSHSLLTGLFIDEHLARTAIATNGQTQSQAQLTDALGSVIALANAQTLSINTSYSYSPYGQTQATGENSSNNQQYTGREAGIEGEAGLYYYRARYYDPVLKRFISEDPIRLEGGLNVYAYVEGDPLSFSDPFGYARSGGKTGKWFGFDNKTFQNWFHRCIKDEGDPDVSSKEEMQEYYNDWLLFGKPDIKKNGDNYGGPPPSAPVTNSGGKWTKNQNPFATKNISLCSVAKIVSHQLDTCLLVVF